MNFKFTHHHLAGSPKYGLSKTLKDSAKLALLLKDDKQSFLSATQRTELLAAVGDKYEKATTKKVRSAKKAKFQGVPMTMAEAVQTLTAEQIVAGLKDGSISPVVSK